MDTMHQASLPDLPGEVLQLLWTGGSDPCIWQGISRDDAQALRCTCRALCAAIDQLITAVVVDDPPNAARQLAAFPKAATLTALCMHGPDTWGYEDEDFSTTGMTRSTMVPGSFGPEHLIISLLNAQPERLRSVRMLRAKVGQLP
jgi:hypothetical protein